LPQVRRRASSVSCERRGDSSVKTVLGEEEKTTATENDGKEPQTSQGSGPTSIGKKKRGLDAVAGGCATSGASADENVRKKKRGLSKGGVKMPGKKEKRGLGGENGTKRAQSGERAALCDDTWGKKRGDRLDKQKQRPGVRRRSLEKKRSKGEFLQSPEGKKGKRGKGNSPRPEGEKRGTANC